MILEISRDRHDHGYSANEPLRPLMATKNVYTVSEQPLGRARKIRIVGIGAGASGLNMILTLRLNLTDYELTVYEKNSDVGGTWFENRYPGCRCDIPSHNYQFSWRPKHDWSNFFAPAEEIGQYLREVCDEEGMREAIKTSHQIVSARWNEQEGIWNLKVRRLDTETEFDDHAHFLVDGTGILNNWMWPVDEGLDCFQGTLIHTASWPESFDPTEKVIAVIGNGASGIQVLPELQRSGAKTLYHVVRTPTWVPPPQIASWLAMGKARVLSEIQVDANGDFSQETIQKFKSDPEFYRRFVKEIEILVSNNFKMMIAGSREQAWARMKVTEYMKLVLGGDEKLCNALIPDYPLGFRRMTPGHSYLQALTQPNVEVKTGGVRRFVTEGLELESGEILKVDAIVCATGFDTSFCPRFPIIGRTGNLQDRWRKQTPKAYMSCAVAGMPNYFTFLGPNAPIGHGSVFTLSEHIAKYITGVIKKCQLEGIKSIAPSQGAVDDYFEHISAFMPRTAWNAPGRSWFTNGKASGPVTALHPGSRIHFFDMLERFRGEDFEYTYDNMKQNRFAYLGNGFSVKEEEGSGADTTWYLDASATIA